MESMDYLVASGRFPRLSRAEEVRAVRGTGMSQRLSRDLLCLKVADVLRRWIIAGDISSGTRLVEDEIATALGVSRVPVREAFATLEGEGLVTVSPGRGTYSRAVTEGWITDLFEIRALLEVRAAERAALRVRADRSLVATLTATLEQLAATIKSSPGDYVTRDFDVHRAIWRMSGSQHLYDVLARIAAPASTLLSLERGQRYPDDSVGLRRHAELVDAVSSGDPGRAAQVVGEHMSHALATTLSSLARLVSLRLATRQ
jgi:DNA-binding GntR family transcriptional regulator